MKKFLCVIPLVLLFFFTIGCQNKAEKAELEKFRAQAKVEEQNMELTKSWLIEVWNKGNLTLIDTIFAPNCIKHKRGSQIEEIKPENLKSEVIEWRQAYSDYENEIGDIFADGDKIAVRFTFRGTNDGPFGDDPPTGKKIGATEMLIWRFENGKVIEIWEEFDSLGFVQQLGFELKPKEVKK
jgi:predicted ester cyclase